LGRSLSSGPVFAIKTLLNKEKRIILAEKSYLANKYYN